MTLWSLENAEEVLVLSSFANIGFDTAENFSWKGLQNCTLSKACLIFRLHFPPKPAPPSARGSRRPSPRPRRARGAAPRTRRPLCSKNAVLALFFGTRLLTSGGSEHTNEHVIQKRFSCSKITYSLPKCMFKIWQYNTENVCVSSEKMHLEPLE